MIVNTQHLTYLTEIERTRSISQAAEILYLSQPNLSRILHDLEADVGFRIFERTSKGVRPTEQGTAFLQHAKKILREVESMNALGPRHTVADRLRICIPRSASYLRLAAAYLAELPKEAALDAVIRECHARQAMDLLAGGQAEIGIIRFRAEYADYFEEQAAFRDLSFELIDKYRYRLVMSATNPLADKPQLTAEDLASQTEIVHGDVFHGCEREQTRKIYCVDRLAQLSLLETVPESFMWTSEMPKSCLTRWNLVQKRADVRKTNYCDALLCGLHYAPNELEQGFLHRVRSMR